MNPIFKSALRGLYRSMQARNPGEEVKDQDLLKEFSDMFSQTILNRIFDGVSGSKKELFGSLHLGNAIYTIPMKNNLKFTKLITAMIKLIRAEGSEKQLTKVPRKNAAQ